MPISIEYDDIKNVIYTNAEGEIKLNDITSYFSSIEKLNLKKEYCVLGDYTNTTLKLSNNDIQTMANLRKKMGISKGIIRIAIFCTQDLVFGLGRMYELLLGQENYKVMIFRSREEAIQCLEI
jgi:hypothetical protein